MFLTWPVLLVYFMIFVKLLGFFLLGIKRIYLKAKEFVKKILSDDNRSKPHAIMGSLCIGS